MNVTDLEIGLHRSEKDEYLVLVRYRAPGGVDQVSPWGKTELDFEALRKFPPSREGNTDYGKALFRQVFADPALVDPFDKALVAAAAAQADLRIRLFLAPTAAALHDLRWELLHDHRKDQPLLNKRVYFSRYLSSTDWWPVQLRRWEALRALVVVADPSDLSAFGAQPIKVEEVLASAQTALGGIPADAVTGHDTLNRLKDALRREYDIVYLVCHAGPDPKTGETRLWLEGADGSVTRVAGGEVVVLLANLWYRPRVLVLCFCYSAGPGAVASPEAGGKVVAAVGPKLAEAGVPAVLAMQGAVSVPTAERFLRAFFEELNKHGRVDQAATVARGMVADRDDAWMPVLFSRSSHGRIWYVPGEAPGTAKPFDGWLGLLQKIEQGNCTPLLGSALLEGLVGSTREVARRWAEETGFAMSPHQREDMPQVTQYLGVVQDLDYPAGEFANRLRKELHRRFDDLPQGAALDDLLEQARARRRKAGKVDPFAALADLPFRVYVSANPDDQLRRALHAAGREPRVELCRWHDREDAVWPDSVFLNDPNFTPEDPRQPLVYHLFGQFGWPASLVLSEDDYFDYLISVHADRSRLPLGIRKKLGGSLLLFLGFRLDEWDFRVLFRSILAQGGKRKLSERLKHVAVQLDPEEGRHADPEKARHYLQEYFQMAHIHIYWGGVEDFLAELRERWRRAHPVAVAEASP